MPKNPAPRQFTKSLGGGAIWIYGELQTPVQHQKGPIVSGEGWMLEMVRFDRNTRTIGVFLAAFGILADFHVPEFSAAGSCSFAGLSFPGNPPAVWLQESMIVDLGRARLPESPAELLAHFANALPYRSIEVGTKASSLSRDVKRRICETYRDDKPISDIAKSFGVSHAHMTRKFKRDFGVSPLSYRNRLRVSEASGRLRLGEDILDVGNEVGFNDTSRFYHDFRKITGVPPGQCRD